MIHKEIQDLIIFKKIIGWPQELLESRWVSVIGNKNFLFNHCKNVKMLPDDLDGSNCKMLVIFQKTFSKIG
jgi:hypothetical protein